MTSQRAKLPKSLMRLKKKKKKRMDPKTTLRHSCWEYPKEVLKLLQFGSSLVAK